MREISLHHNLAAISLRKFSATIQGRHTINNGLKKQGKYFSFVQGDPCHREGGEIPFYSEEASSFIIHSHNSDPGIKGMWS